MSISYKLFSFQDTDTEITPTKSPWTLETKPQSGMKKLFGESQTYSTQQKLNELAGLFADKFNGNNCFCFQMASKDVQVRSR